jgi:hypothetical protein
MLSSLASCGGIILIVGPQLRHPEDGNHLPKHVGVNLEYMNKSTCFWTHLLVILQRYYKMLGPTIKIGYNKI